MVLRKTLRKTFNGDNSKKVLINNIYFNGIDGWAGKF